MVRAKVIEDFGNMGHSGVLQLRCINEEKLEQILEYVKGFEGLCKIVLARHGYDVYVGPRGVMNKLVHQLPIQFGGKISITKNLLTKKRLTSKEVHRLFVLFWAFPFNPGDIVVHDGAPIKITSNGKRISGLNMATGKRLSFEFDPKQKLEWLEIKSAEVSQTHPELKLIHPDSFQPVVPQNPRLEKEYKVVVLGNKLYIV